MPLSAALPQLETDIEQLLLDLSKSENPEQARQDYAQRLAKAIHAFVGQGLVQTTGTAASQVGKII
jgi:Asp-tRNA(Asn)/Glu-tRNA(Gln) amidotransferase B subunit